MCALGILSQSTLETYQLHLNRPSSVETVQEQEHANMGGGACASLVLPNSGHLYYGTDWGVLSAAIGALVGAQRTPSPPPPPPPLLPSLPSTGEASAAALRAASDAAAAAALTAGALSAFATAAADASRLSRLRASLRRCERSASVVPRSYGYLGRLVSGARTPRSVLRQASAQEQRGWLLPGRRESGAQESRTVQPFFSTTGGASGGRGM